jgi:uncharacterized iron-regulated protein
VRTRALILAAAAAAVVLLLSPALRSAPEAAPATGQACVAPARWLSLQATAIREESADALLARLAARPAVLLGEGHDIPEHHRWQLHTVAALHARQPRMVMAFEMFPRSVQPVLDRWVRGELSETQLLRATDWQRNWGYDAQMYLPLFHFARMHRIPMVALNVDRDFSRAVGEKGYDALPPERRAEVGRPAPPLPAYEAFLFESFAQHGAGEKARRDDPAFRRFLEAQQVWDRAMAERIATARARDPAALVVGIMGTGHLMNGWGVPHQLRALGVRDPAVLLPWEPENDCQRLQPGYADAVFGLAAREEPAPQRPRLGLWLDPASGGVQIRQIEKGGLGEQAGLRVGDVLVEIAGRAPAEPADVSDAVQRQAPGTWLPLKVRREGRTFEVIAKFPPAAS